MLVSLLAWLLLWASFTAGTTVQPLLAPTVHISASASSNTTIEHGTAKKAPTLHLDSPHPVRMSATFIDLSHPVNTADIPIKNDSQTNSRPKRVRKEIRDLTEEERASLIASFWTLAENGVMARLTTDHWNWSKKTHGKPAFIVYHRALTLEFEDELLKVNSLLTGLPYWDWTLDFQHPPSSIVLTPDWFGPTPSANDTCIEIGAFAHFPALQCSPKKNTACLSRGFGGTIRSTDWVSPALVDAIIRRSGVFDKFARSLEASIHPYPHLGFGGHMKTMCSAADPIFYLHHSNIDRMYVQWQKTHFGAGPQDPRWASQQEGSHLPDSTLIPYYNRTVASYLDSEGDLHYTYANATTPVRYLKPLALPPPIPRSWHDMNHWSDATIREQENFIASLTKQLNGYAAKERHGSLTGVNLDTLWQQIDADTSAKLEVALPSMAHTLVIPTILLTLLSSLSILPTLL